MIFPNDDEAVAYVEQELKAALPDGWRIKKSEPERLAWRIIPPASLPGGREDYRIRMSGDRKEFILEYGNTDAGRPGLLHHFLVNAKVMSVDALQFYSLSDAVAAVIQTCKPNRWGLT